MNKALFAAAVIVAGISPLPAEQIPADQPADWTIAVRFFGTTDQPNRDFYRVFVHRHGEAAVRLRVDRPIYDELGKIKSETLSHDGAISNDTASKFYAAARTIIQNHRLGVEPP